MKVSLYKLRPAIRAPGAETRRPKEARNPKPEGRKKAEGRSPKAELIGLRKEAWRTERFLLGFRISDFGLLSAFGLRVSGFRRRPSAFGFRPSRLPGEHGVALVITLIMLSVITFMAISFLVLSRGERSSVGTSTDQSLARLAADNALERAQIELVAPMMASGNVYGGGLMVSTNFINPLGFLRGSAAVYSSSTNVAYNYASGFPLTMQDMLQNQANLLFNPRPPVFIVTNKLTGASDFGYYLDLNRNGMFEPTGWIGVTNGVGGQVQVPGNKFQQAVDYVQGDPQWIGALEFPDRHHSPDNRFLYRYAYLVVPTSQALDINYIHNQAFNPAKATINPTGADFLRNQGVGTWEINLASFLYDLNTNLYAWGGPYTYQPQVGVQPQFVRGNAFVDACSILANRYGGLNYPTRLASVHNLFFNGSAAFANHTFDGYTAGPIMTGPSAFAYSPDFNPTPRVNYPWPGADNTNHFFSTQDLFDPAKTSPNFAFRLQAAGTNIDTYDRYTFYRLLSQLGTDSAPEPARKINLNFDNRVQANGLGVVSATNFFPWRPVDFFTNTAAMLLTNAGFNLSLNNIQVYPTNFYTPSVHRLLQLAANVFDATTNRALVVGQTNAYFPSVFRPIFRSLPNGTNTLIVIAGYTEVRDAQMAFQAPLTIPLDTPGANLANFRPYGTPFQNAVLEKNEVMVYGVPLIIGAKKNLPNFNEFAMQTQVYISRLLEFRRAAGNPNTSPIVRTNQMYVMSITNSFGVEAWNSYLASYPRSVQLVCSASMYAQVTNELGVANVVYTNRAAFGVSRSILAGSWPGSASPNSFVLPFNSTNSFLFLTNSTFIDRYPWFQPETHIFPVATRGNFYVPHWWLNLNTRLQYILVDTAVFPNRIIDYVNINNWEQTVDLTAQLAQGNTAAINAADYRNPANQWITNHLGNSQNPNTPTYGVFNQIQIGLNGTTDMQSYSMDPYSGLDAESAVDGFRFNLAGLSPIYPKDMAKTFYKSNVFYAPYDPYRPIFIHTSWQANDPLVHYTVGDLTDLSLDPTNRVNFYSKVPPLDNLGRMNTRYRPWGGNPGGTDPLTDYQIALKDPNVTRSDDWDFPTNKFPNIGWLGRVHRGTPWQTVFLKSTNILQSAGRFDLSLLNWAIWTGNPLLVRNAGQIITNLLATNAITSDAIFTAPTNDWRILDLFTTAINDNAGRGQLSINQTNLAAWSAILSGVNVLPNTSTNLFIQPAGVYNPAFPPPLVAIVNGINRARTNFANNAFVRLGDILSTPELTMASPYLIATNRALINDAVVERIPQQILGLVHGGDQPPRYVIYAYGQALKPAGPRSFYMGSGPYFGLCTNYQITAEVATRAVIRVDGAPSKPRTVIESFNVLPPD